MRSLLLAILITVYLPLFPNAQTIDRNSFGKTDSLVSALGPMRDSSLGAIVRSITAGAPDDATKMRAIYYWASKNIAFDCARRHTPERVNNTTSYVIKSRSATGEGFAGLISEMCRMSYLRCETVRGIAKWEPEEIDHVSPEDARHSWNVVRLKDRQYVLDAAWGAGRCEGRHFTAELTDAWFLTNRRLFALSHFPDDKKMQLLDTPVERSAFVAAPVARPMASIIGLIPAPGQRGTIRGREGKTTNVTFLLPPSQRVTKASVLANGDAAPAEFRQMADTLTISIPFAKDGEYAVYVLVDTEQAINAGPAIGFWAMVSKGDKRRR